jgi:nucleoside-diphosphate-sugar epimerase
MVSQMGGLDLTLITGASGFVGSAIAKAFRESGHQVRALVRASSPTINIDPADMVVVGDICDRNTVTARFAACAIWSTPQPITGSGHHLRPRSFEQM